MLSKIGIKFISNVIDKLNTGIVQQIINDFKMNKMEEELFKDKLLKYGYVVPTIIDDINTDTMNEA